MLHQMQDGAVIFRAVYRRGQLADFTWVATNAVNEQALGRSEAELVGRLHSVEYPTAHRELFEDYCQVLRSGAARRRELHYQGEGLDLWLDLSILPISRCEIMLVYRDISELKEQSARDSLTGLYNRRAFTQIWGSQDIWALLRLSLERFRWVNNAAGHEIGDLILIEVARRIGAVTKGADPVYRDGGTFIILLVNPVSRARAMVIGGRFVEAVERPFEIAGGEFRLSACVDVSPQTGGLSVRDLLSRTDLLAALRVRDQSLPPVLCATADVIEASYRRAALEGLLRDAAERRELFLLYQPIVNLQVEGYPIVGFEALARWQSPSYGLVQPAEFIPIAEDAGLIQRITDWALLEAFEQAQSWRRQTGQPCRISVNCSALDLIRPNFQSRVEALAKGASAGLSILTIELTETALASDPGQITPAIEAIQALGALTAIDDFGAGYNNLINLIRLPVDIIKIDREFISGERASPDLCSSIMAIASHGGRAVVAEGVETVEQAAMLKFLGCDYGQGWLFGRPVAAEAALELIR